MSNPDPSPPTKLTRARFLTQSACALGALTLTATLRSQSNAAAGATKATDGSASAPSPVYDLREFVSWIQNELEPSVRLPGGAGRYAREIGAKTTELYGVADMACILYSIGQLHFSEEERQQWAAAFDAFQDPTTGFLIEKDPSHTPLHNTAFALSAMQLFQLEPKRPVQIDPIYRDIRTFLGSLDWRTKVYPESHKGAGIGCIFALIPSLHSHEWFDQYFTFCDSLFDSRNGMMGRDKPAAGDSDQVGGTFHYAFLYELFHRRMPYPEKRIDAVIGLQQPDGYWDSKNHLWLTLDAIYLLTRTLRHAPHRREDVIACVRRAMDALQRDAYSPEGRKTMYTGKLAVHSVTAAINIAAEVQDFLGADQVVTNWPLRLVLDRRPFI